MKNKWTIGGLFILLLGTLSFYTYSLTARKKNQIQYRQVPVVRGDLEVTILGTGTVQPENRLEIKPPVSGRVESIFVKEGENVHKGQVLALMSSTERAVLIDAARSQGPEELKKWEENYRAIPVVSPLSGTLIRRNVEPGQTFTVSDAIFVVSDHLIIKAQVDETDIGQIRLKQTATVVLDAYPQDPFPAYVQDIAYEAKTISNVTTYIVDVAPEKPPQSIRSGMTANVTFLVNSKKGVLMVPNEALKVRENAYSVLASSPTVPDALRGSLLKSSKNGSGLPPPNSETPVGIGLQDAKMTEIISGLSEGQVVWIAELGKLGSGETSKGVNPFSPMGGGGSRDHGDRNRNNDGNGSGHRDRNPGSNGGPPP